LPVAIAAAVGEIAISWFVSLGKVGVVAAVIYGKLVTAAATTVGFVVVDWIMESCR
jgi:hypothetical protein